MWATSAQPADTAAFTELTGLADGRPPGAVELDPATLPPVQRTLLGLGGMVTQFLEQVWGEPIAINLFRQFRLQIGAALPALDCPPRGVVAREVTLSGAASGRLYGHARTLLLPDRIGAEAADAILEGPEGIGRALARLGRPTRREILWSGGLEADPDDDDLPPALGSPCLARVYRILVAGRPAILILERFPRDPA